MGVNIPARIIIYSVKLVKPKRCLGIGCTWPGPTTYMSMVRPYFGYVHHRYRAFSTSIFTPSQERDTTGPSLASIAKLYLIIKANNHG